MFKWFKKSVNITPSIKSTKRPYQTDPRYLEVKKHRSHFLRNLDYIKGFDADYSLPSWLYSDYYCYRVNNVTYYDFEDFPDELSDNIIDALLEIIYHSYLKETEYDKKYDEKRKTDMLIDKQRLEDLDSFLTGDLTSLDKSE